MATSEPSRLLLFDIDGTLINSFGAMRLFDKTLSEIVGAPAATGGVYHGSTDPKIVREKLVAMGVDPAPDLVSRILTRLEDLLEAEVASGATTEAKPGAHELLGVLSDDGRFALSVLTGNTVRNAKSKLKAAGVDHYFDLGLGAFGSDSPERNDLVPVAMGRFYERYGRVVAGERVVVIGDTERDLECAVAGGVRCVLVATGAYSHPELSALGAELTVNDLLATEELLAVLRF
jgi:phosphoglycolate phosphatase-like HAD superfamily hydrolase